MKNTISDDDYVVDQNWDSYTDRDHATWAQLFDRMSALAPGRMCDEFLTGLKVLDLPSHEVVRFEDLSEKLLHLTGWQYVAVDGYIPARQFFELLANKQFPSSRLMRNPDETVYQSLPDIFHDVFGHAPLLANSAMANLMQSFGSAGVACKNALQEKMIARLYWYTVEVGLLHSENKLLAYGAAIASSEKEFFFSRKPLTP